MSARIMMNTNRQRPWQDGRLVAVALVALALIIYALGFRAAEFSWFDAAGAATAHVLPGAAAATAAWHAQDWLYRNPYLAAWFLHAVLAIVAGLLWLALMLAITLAAKPEIIGHVMEAAALSTMLSGIIVYGAVAFVHALLASRQLVAEGQAALARAELSALRARVEPHFLYNTLETIAGLVSANPRAAEDGIARLGRLLRRVLEERAESGTDDALIPLGEELAIARDYLAIEKLRLASRLMVIEKIQPETLGLGIPALSIQTLVENAVIHGIVPKPEGGMVSITAERQVDTLIVAIADDGAGADAQIFETGGNGLELLRKRLKNHFAGQAALEVEARPGHGVSIRLAIPAVEAE